MTKQEERLRQRYPDTNSFKFHNENPKGHICGDCLYRAFAGATGLAWNEVVDIAAKEMKKNARDADFSLTKWAEKNGWARMHQPKNKDGTKVTGDEFCKLLNHRYPSDDYAIIASIGAHHIVCIKPVYEDGYRLYKVHDVWNSTGRVVGRWWMKKIEEDNIKLQEKYPLIAGCADAKYLFNELDASELDEIENVLDLYGEDIIQFQCPSDECGDFTTSIADKAQINEQIDLERAEIILKWYESFEDTGYMVSVIRGDI